MSWHKTTRFVIFLSTLGSAHSSLYLNNISIESPAAGQLQSHQEPCCSVNHFNINTVEVLLVLRNSETCMPSKYSHSSHINDTYAIWKRRETLLCRMKGSYPPWKGDVVFGLSVCLSGTLFFSFCARNSSYSFHHTQTKPIPSESWMSGVCHGGSVFSYPPKISAK